jgi:nucleotide-binding universal stress UspA family protein
VDAVEVFMPTLAEDIQKKIKVSFKRILVATDFSPASRLALAEALRIARKYGSDLTLVHAIAPPGSYQPIPLDPLPRELDRQLLQAEDSMSHLAHEFPIGDVPHHFVIREGEIWDLLSAVMLREDTDLIILGTHGREGLKKVVLGSTAEQVVRSADVPVLTVGPHVTEPSSASGGLKNILFATDFGPASDKALPYALSLAQEYDAKLILVHVVPMVAVGTAAYAAGEFAASEVAQWESRVQEDSQEKLRKLVPSDARFAQTPEFVISRNFVPEGILGMAATHHADLIVMGVNPSSSPRLASHLPWSVAHDVLCQANCPVLTVKA